MVTKRWALPALLYLSAMAFVALLAGTAQAGPLSAWLWPIDDVPGKQTILIGRSAPDGFGHALAAGDVNGDGREDLIAGAPYVYAPLRGQGEVYVIPGPLGFGQLITVPHHVALTLRGPAMDAQVGRDVNTGDLNGDGCDDVVASSLSPPAAYVYLGSPDITTARPLTVSLTAQTAALTVFGGSGHRVCNINGDGYADLFLQKIVLLPSWAELRVFGFLGHGGLSMAQPLSVEIGVDTADVTITGIVMREFTWRQPTNLACDDIDGDGYQDLAVGAYSQDHDGLELAGRVYLVAGSPEITRTRPVTVALPGQAAAILQRVEGGGAGDHLGEGLAAGDVDGDGLAELIVGAPYGHGPHDHPVYAAGEIYLWPGHALHGQVIDLGIETPWLVYGNTQAYLGEALDAADLDGDGRDEILAGCSGCARKGAEPYTRGAGYVLDAEKVQGEQLISAAASLVTIPTARYYMLGWAVGSMDWNGDGYVDLLLSNPGNPYTLSEPGRVLVVPYPGHHRLYLPVITCS